MAAEERPNRLPVVGHFAGFKAFLLRSNALALAIGVIIGAAAGGVVNSLVNDIIMPPIGLFLGRARAIRFTTLTALCDVLGCQPGDILFWSSAPNGVHTSWKTTYHTGIYLGNGWTINSHGSGDGVTIDYMGPGAGWYHDAFAFGWRVMPLHR